MEKRKKDAVNWIIYILHFNIQEYLLLCFFRPEAASPDCQTSNVRIKAGYIPGLSGPCFAQSTT